MAHEPQRSPHQVRQGPIGTDTAIWRKTPKVARERVQKASGLSVHVGVGEQRLLFVENVVRQRAAHVDEYAQHERGREGGQEPRVLLTEVGLESGKPTAQPLAQGDARLGGDGAGK